ncbi:unnamed protein product, partial [Musa textilis]
PNGRRRRLQGTERNLHGNTKRRRRLLPAVQTPPPPQRRPALPPISRRWPAPPPPPPLRPLWLPLPPLSPLLPPLPPCISSSSPPPHPLASGSAVAPLADGSRAGRGLSRVLFAVAHVPVASRKYDFVRSLAERILDDNLRATGGADLQTLNRTALSAAFARTLHGLEEALAAEAASANGVRAWAAGRVVPPAGEEGAGESAEKLASEAMWLGQKMAENGAAAEAVAMWGTASRLAGLAVSAEPRLQVAIVRVCVFSFAFFCSGNTATRLALALPLRLVVATEPTKDPPLGPMVLPMTRQGETSLASHQISMLKSWLPLLCCACSGVDSPILSSKERAEMVSLLGDMIGKFNWDQQEEVLSLWLYHFTNCPDSDWPNLESCYIRWYLESQELFLK